MSGGAKSVNIARLMTSSNLEIKAVPNNLKCAECKSVLKDACQLPCGCRFCRLCIDAVVAKGAQFCPGGSEECGETSLSTALPDYRANKSIARLTATCPLSGCHHECPLADMEAHLSLCPQKCLDCPFRGLGCQQGKLAEEEMSVHLQQESSSHSEILIGLVANVNRDMAELKRELAMKDEQMRTMMDEMSHVQNENKSMKVEMESIKREKEALSDRVRQLSEKMEREIEKRRERDERESARITAITKEIGSNQDELRTQIQPIKSDIRFIKRDIESIQKENTKSTNQEDIEMIKCEIDFIKWQVQSTRMAARLGQVDAIWDMVINDTLVELFFPFWCKSSDLFKGVTRPYTYRVMYWNKIITTELKIQLRVYADPSNTSQRWPFRGTVTITVSNMGKHEVRSSQTKQCRIERPTDHDSSDSDSDENGNYGSSEIFAFPYSDLKAAGLKLGSGVIVSCHIVPGGGQ